MKGKYYDIAFHLLNDHVFVKKEVYSEKEPFAAWKDACVNILEEELHIFANDKHTILNRSLIVRIDALEVISPLDKDGRNKGNLTKVVDTLNSFGI
ncbi:MAG: hypothetical protein LBT69_02430 [Lactobacillales bacterium]|jgi:hypothetical protein|nr:hypothetical protein [Lactobacillales bacterium]